MKTQFLQKSFAVLAVAGFTLLAVDAGAQTVTPLPYNATQIAQLAQAKVSDDTILAYIRNSNDSYNLDASQIIYLKQQGVSDAVISTMLNQPRIAIAPASAPATSAPQVASTSTATVAPTVTYVQSVPDTTYYYASPSYYYPYSYPYYGWGYSPVISVGFGGGWRGGGGWHGGYGGGGWHGGGGHGGGWHH